MFSSDYPHPEGGTDPLAKSDATLADTDETARNRFYCTNYAELMDLFRDNWNGGVIVAWHLAADPARAASVR